MIFITAVRTHSLDFIYENLDYVKVYLSSIPEKSWSVNFPIIIQKIKRGLRVYILSREFYSCNWFSRQRITYHSDLITQNKCMDGGCLWQEALAKWSVYVLIWNRNLQCTNTSASANASRTAHHRAEKVDDKRTVVVNVDLFCAMVCCCVCATDGLISTSVVVSFPNESIQSPLLTVTTGMRLSGTTQQFNLVDVWHKYPHRVQKVIFFVIKLL